MKLEIGAKAPDFSVADGSGKRVRLADILKDAQGNPRGAVLYFYPKDMTPGCTTQARDFQASLAEFAKLGLGVYGVSRDSAASHQKFCSQESLAFPLLSDPELTLHKAYGAWGTKTTYGKVSEGVLRSTFVIGPDGILTHAAYNVKATGHVASLLRKLA